MARYESFLDRHFAKLLFCAAAGLLAAYVTGIGAADPDPPPNFDVQKYVRPPDEYVGVAWTKPTRKPGEYLDESRPDIFNLPKIGEEVVDRVAVPLEPPLPSIGAPPVPLPLPGPRLEFTGALPRMKPGSTSAPPPPPAGGEAEGGARPE